MLAAFFGLFQRLKYRFYVDRDRLKTVWWKGNPIFVINQYRIIVEALRIIALTWNRTLLGYE
ncbi:hypothetical protein VEZ01S_05_01160 [Vibrio ezurae NBRC 102218]|uniref:Uncharacterized protein n=1 Tax=Vibrio ezurae NBRC 102218 TaxID=1219080 RepID=U3AZT7_9VIBR|nr:hypothetical protein VEZ01S_05_01160 [Vibrio ezurae NBRC 102218]